MTKPSHGDDLRWKSVWGKYEKSRVTNHTAGKEWWSSCNKIGMAATFLRKNWILLGRGWDMFGHDFSQIYAENKPCVGIVGTCWVINDACPVTGRNGAIRHTSLRYLIVFDYA